MLYARDVHSICLCFVGFSWVQVSCKTRKNPGHLLLTAGSMCLSDLHSGLSPVFYVIIDFSLQVSIEAVHRCVFAVYVWAPINLFSITTCFNFCCIFFTACLDLGHMSSGGTGPKALSFLVLLYIYWTHNWYISILPIIDQLTFSAAPPLLSSLV